MRLLRIAVAMGSLLALLCGCTPPPPPTAAPKSSPPAKSEPVLTGTFKVQVANNISDDGKSSP
ncbi:MAG TPA: hypothetical protein VML93_37105, partial [Mycobacterium sp.]|nr:hypothetical protein [Mycobacterium sp.]